MDRRKPLTSHLTWRPAQKCGHPTRWGQTCERNVAPGQRACHLHIEREGATVFRSDATHLLSLRGTALTVIERQLVTGDVAPHVVRTALAVLDRTGFGPGATVTVDQTVDEHAFTAASDEELAARARALVQLLDRARTLTGEVVDAK